jgi:hypothetical protein
LISHTEAIRLLEEPAAVPAELALPAEKAAPVAPTEEEIKAKAKEESDALADQVTANKKAEKNFRDEQDKLQAHVQAEKSDFDKYMHSIASTTHKESKEFDSMQTDMYTRDMGNYQKAKDDKLIAKGLTPPGSIATKDDEELSEAQKEKKFDMIKLIAANKKGIEDKDKAYWAKVNGTSGDDWARMMPEKYLSGPQYPGPGPDKPKKDGGKLVEGAPAQAEGAADAPAVTPAAPATEAAPAAPPA